VDRPCITYAPAATAGGAILGAMSAGPALVTSPDDPRLGGMGQGDVPGADQIPQMLAASPRERLQCLVEMLAFEERAHKAVRLPKVP
jgi:hypothetical protein